MTQNNKLRILYISHCYNNRGGVEEHVKALEAGLGEGFEVHVAYPENGKAFLKTPTGTKEFAADSPKWPITPYNLPALEQALEQILQESSADILHIQHFLNWHLGVIDQVLSYGRPVALSFHEYYAITPHFTMEGVAEPKDTLSVEYSENIFGADITDYLRQRRDTLIKSFSNISTQIVPSKFLALELAKAFPREYRVIPHGIAPFATTHQQRKKDTLQFVYLGSLIPQKGWESLVEGFMLAQEKHSNIELHLYGGGNNEKFTGKENIFFYSAYDRSDVSSILSTADVGVIPSVFRETFSYVLSEMWQAGLPVLASDIGALGERIRAEGGGTLFSPGDAASICEAVSHVCENPIWLQQEIPSPRTLDEMLEEYRTLYEELANE